MNKYLTILCALAIGLWNAQSAGAKPGRVINDFDGDGRTDPAIYYPASGQWWVYLMASGTVTNVTTWRGPNYLPAPGDYDGDGKTDFMIFNSATAMWYGKYSSGMEVEGQFGMPGSWPVPADYDGDRVTDPGVYDPLTGIWSVLSLSKGWAGTVKWGYLGDFRPWDNPQTYTVLPMPFDYNQDGIDDLAYYYRGMSMETSGWSIMYMGADVHTNYYVFGSSGSLPAPGNYRSQAFDVPRGVCVYKLTTAEWFIPYVSPFPFVLGTYGQTLPVPAGDYDGNGYDDNAVYNYVTGEWTILSNTGTGDAAGKTQVSGYFGDANAIPANIYSTIYKLGRYTPKAW